MVRQKAFYHHAEGRMTQLTTTPSSRTDAELLAAVRDAIYRVTTGHQSITIDGVVYTLANLDQLRRMEGKEGLILQGCGGSLLDWQNGINNLLTEARILKNGTQFETVYAFQHEGTTCLLFPFEGSVELDVGKLAMWRLQSHSTFGGTWLSDYVWYLLSALRQRWLLFWFWSWF